MDNTSKLLISFNMILISNQLLKAEINPQGAELTFLARLTRENVLWSKDEKFWNRIAPNLFPIVGRLKNDTYSHHEKTYSMSQHGFARDCVFEVVEQNESSVLFRLISNEKTKEHYPFEFTFEVRYSLIDNEIEISYKVINRGEEELPYSVGGHPGFAIKGKINDYFLDFGNKISTEQWLLEGSYYSGMTKKITIDKILPLNYQLFENDAIVFRNPEFHQVILSHKSKGKIVGLSSDNMSAIGFWTKNNAPFLCIEPWWGWADKQDCSRNILEKEGIHILNKNESRLHSYRIQLF